MLHDLSHKQCHVLQELAGNQGAVIVGLLEQQVQKNILETQHAGMAIT